MQYKDEAWLAAYIQLEIDELLRLKREHRLPGFSGTHTDPPIRRKYFKTNGGLKICYNVGHLHRIVQLIELVDVQYPVTVTVADVTSLVLAKFSHKAIEASSDRDRIQLKEGTFLKLEDYEVHLTLLGDEARHISLLINKVHVLRRAALDTGPFKPLLASSHMRKSLHALLSNVTNENRSKHETDDTVIELDSDIASQDERCSNSLSREASQVPFATQAQPYETFESKIGANLGELQGVDLSCLQRPKGNTGSLNPGTPEQPFIHPTAKQLLALLPTQGGIGSGEGIAQDNAKCEDGTELKAKAQAQRTVPHPDGQGELVPTPPNFPSYALPNSTTSDYSPIHKGDFAFVKHVGAFNRPDDRQRNLLRDPASWHYPLPPFQFPGLNVPVDVLTDIKSRIAEKENEHKGDSGNRESVHKVPEEQGYGPLEDKETAAKDGKDVTSDDLPQTPSSAYSGWCPSDSSHSATGHAASPHEPRDSSVERPKTSSVAGAECSAKTKKRPHSPYSHPRDLNYEKRQKTDELISQPADAENPAFMARRMKREWVEAHRSRQARPDPQESLVNRFPDDTSYSDVDNLPLLDMSPTGLSKNCSSSPVPDASQRTVLQIRSPDISATSHPQFSSNITTSALHTDKVTESSNSNEKRSLEGSIGGNRPQIVRTLSRGELHTVIGRSESYSVQNSHDARVSSSQSLTSKNMLSNSTNIEHRGSLPWLEGSRSVTSSKSRSKSPYPENQSLGYSLGDHQKLQRETKLIRNRQHKRRYQNRGFNQVSSTHSVERSGVAAASELGKSGRREPQHTSPSDVSSRSQWWKSEDTVFKRFARDFASLKSIGGSLGNPCEGIPISEKKDVSLLEWRF